MRVRNDIHSPANIVPADYDFVGYRVRTEFDDFEYIAQQREIINKHMERMQGKYASHDHGGTCMICGARAESFGIFYHIPSNEYICSGLDCAEKMFEFDSSLFRKAWKTAKDRAKGKAKAITVLDDLGMSQAWEIYQSNSENVMTDRDSQIVRELVGNLVKYGSWSDKQINFCKTKLNVINTAEERRVIRAKEHENAENVPEGKIVVEGVIVSKKTEETIYGYVTKIIVKGAAGWKVYGTLGKDIAEAEYGSMVRFNATVTASGNDPKFGFFSRPSKGVIIR